MAFAENYEYIQRENAKGHSYNLGQRAKWWRPQGEQRVVAKVCGLEEQGGDSREEPEAMWILCHALKRRRLFEQPPG